MFGKLEVHVLEVVWRFEPITFYIGELRVKLVLATHVVLKLTLLWSKGCGRYSAIFVDRIPIFEWSVVRLKGIGLNQPCNLLKRPQKHVVQSLSHDLSILYLLAHT